MEVRVSADTGPQTDARGVPLLLDTGTLSLLRDVNMGLVMAHHPWYPRFKEATAGFAYLRLLGRRDVFPDFSRVHGQQDDALQGWVEVLRALAPQIERSFIFVNNQFEGHSPETVRRLLDEHQASRADHADRLWALLILELWHREFLP